MDQARHLLTQWPTPFCVQAQRQQSGYGRQKRSWLSPEGNLYVTFALTPPCGQNDCYQLSFVSALAVYDVIRACLPRDISVSLKWPNDVLLSGKKVAGILLEYHDAPQALLVGIGLNSALSPLDTATDLKTHGDDRSVSRLLKELIHFFTNRYDQWRNKGFSSICQDWMAVGPLKGERLTITHQKGVFHGLYEGLDPYGALILATASGKKMFFSGDVLY